MSIEPQPPSSYSPSPISDEPSGPLAKPPNNMVAPIWHLLLIVALILGNSLLGSSKLAHAGGGGHGSRLLLYASTFITELVLILLVWFGIRLRGVRMRDLIGGRWNTVEDFLLDIGLAVGFWIVSLALLFGLRVALGLINLHNLAKSTDETFRVLGPLAPRSYLEAGSFVALSIAAGLFEEIIFRGYLQRQFHALARNAALGIILSGIVFGLAHGYQGARLMVVIAVFGIFFGILAYLRKSLRPGMIAHAMQDSLAGIVLFLYFLRHH